MNARAQYRAKALLALALVVGGCTYAVYDSRRAERAPQPILGMVRRTEIRLAPRVSGRLGAISAIPGARIAKGAVVAVLDAPELSASLREANAAAASAAADRANTYAGVREEEKSIAKQAVDAAQANVVLAGEERDRANALAAKGFATPERVDQDDANFASTSATLAIKKAAYAEASAGPTVEERGIADAHLLDARASAEATAARVARNLADIAGRRRKQDRGGRGRRNRASGTDGRHHRSAGASLVHVHDTRGQAWRYCDRRDYEA